MTARAKPVLLVGDLIIDVHHYGKNAGTSREAAIPVGVHERETTAWGGAGLVARNLLALRTPTVFFSVVGDDAQGKEAARFSHPLLTKRLIAEKGRATIVKERFLLDGAKALRWNRGNSKPVSKASERELLRAVVRALPKAGALLISDYRHGVLSKEFAAKLIHAAHKAKVPVYADSQVTRIAPNHAWYRDADAVVVNEDEAHALSPGFDRARLAESLGKLGATLRAGIVLKLGKDGSRALIGGEYIETAPKKVTEKDATGAGDAFFAALGSRGAITAASLRHANDWGALAVTMEGTEPPRLSMLKK